MAGGQERGSNQDMMLRSVHINKWIFHQLLHQSDGIFRRAVFTALKDYLDALLGVALVADIMAVFTARRAHETPAAHPAEAFESIISVGIGSISNAFAIDADGIMWDMAIHGDGDWREQTAPQADAVWCP